MCTAPLGRAISSSAYSILWSLPTAFMIGELSSALPFEAVITWVRRRYGQLLGFQEAGSRWWLDLRHAIYPKRSSFI